MPDRNAFTDGLASEIADKAGATSSDEARLPPLAGDGPAGSVQILRQRDIDLTMGWLEAWIVPLA